MPTLPPPPTISRLTLVAPIKAGLSPALANCTYSSRVIQLFETLGAGWSSWRGHPWSQAYANVVADVPGVHSFRLAVLEPPGSILFESTFEGDLATHVNVVRRHLGPLLDLVFCNSDGYPGAVDGSDDAFAGWVAKAQAGGSFPGPSAMREVAELIYLRKIERANTSMPVDEPSADSAGYGLFALSDLHRMANLYSTPEDAANLHRAARSLLPAFAPPTVGANLAEESMLLDRFAESIRWFGDTVDSIGTNFAGAVAETLGSPDATPVCGKKLVMKVLMDLEGNYSVSGYAERMGQSFGHIYLGLDKTDPEYDRQSAVSNAAIGKITERDAFSRALAETRAVMKVFSGTVTYDIQDLSDQVLAALCTGWFDVPDGINVVAGGQSLFRPPKCPGHFAAPSGFIFQPEPNVLTAFAGRLQGQWLHEAMLEFVRARRASGKPLKGELSKALFAAFPESPGQDDLLARTLVGVMIGLLPTVQFNLINTMHKWGKTTFDRLKHDFLSHPETDLYVRAGAVIRKPLIATMQQVPMPPKVWRTAVRDHDLGDNPVIRVKTGTRVAVDIQSATLEDHDANIEDVTPIFGGDRRQTPHPTHACPGLWMGMGILLGIVAGTLEAAPTQAPFTVTPGMSPY